MNRLHTCVHRRRTKAGGGAKNQTQKFTRVSCREAPHVHLTASSVKLLLTVIGWNPLGTLE